MSKCSLLVHFFFRMKIMVVSRHAKEKNVHQVLEGHKKMRPTVRRIHILIASFILISSSLGVFLSPSSRRIRFILSASALTNSCGGTDHVPMFHTLGPNQPLSSLGNHLRTQSHTLESSVLFYISLYGVIRIYFIEYLASGESPRLSRYSLARSCLLLSRKENEDRSAHEK